MQSVKNWLRANGFCDRCNWLIIFAILCLFAVVGTIEAHDANLMAEQGYIPPICGPGGCKIGGRK